MKLQRETEVRIAALEHMLTILITTCAVREGIPDKEASLMFKAAYSEAVKHNSEEGLIGLDNMFERVMKFIHGE